MGMRISSGNSSTQATGGAAAWQQRQQNFQTLSKALQANDLDGAKAAYAALASQGSGKAPSNPNSPLAQLGKALQSGDLGAAQQAFADMRAKHGHGRGETLASQPAAASAPTATSGNYLNVVA